MDEDDLPPAPHRAEETGAGNFGQLIGAGLWIALFVAIAGIVLYILLRAHG
ncbi:MAG TPA: hypothetical protein VL971_05450 [Rhizomicrobium sp.]|nr:hypothetical protein [Rhizomicrobium sp.]